MSELTEEQMGEIALRILRISIETASHGDEYEKVLREGISHVVKETGVTNEKALQFLERLQGIALNCDEEEMGEIALKFIRKRAQRYLKSPEEEVGGFALKFIRERARRNMKRVYGLARVIAERNNISDETAVLFVRQFLS